MTRSRGFIPSSLMLFGTVLRVLRLEIPVRLARPFTQVCMHNHREDNDQSVDQLGPETSQADSHGRRFDGANDESPEEGSQNCADAAGDGRVGRADMGG